MSGFQLPGWNDPRFQQVQKVRHPELKKPAQPARSSKSSSSGESWFSRLEYPPEWIAIKVVLLAVIMVGKYMTRQPRVSPFERSRQEYNQHLEKFDPQKHPQFSDSIRESEERMRQSMQDMDRRISESHQRMQQERLQQMRQMDQQAVEHARQYLNRSNPYAPLR